MPESQTSPPESFTTARVISAQAATARCITHLRSVRAGSGGRALSDVPAAPRYERGRGSGRAVSGRLALGEIVLLADFSARRRRARWRDLGARRSGDQSRLPDRTPLVAARFHERSAKRGRAMGDFDSFGVPGLGGVRSRERSLVARLLERNGFHNEGILSRKWSLHPNVSDVPRDCFCYAKTRL